MLKITRGSTEKKQHFTADVICFSNLIETFQSMGCVGRQGTFLLCGPVRIYLLKFSLESQIDYTFRVAIFQKK